MKYPILLVIPFLIASCGKSEEEKKADQAKEQFVAMQIEMHQKAAWQEAGKIYDKLNPKLLEQIASGRDCKGAEISNTLATKYVNKVDVNQHCEIIISFFKSAYTPDLNDQTITFTAENPPLWKCKLSKKYKEEVNFLPKACQ